MYVVCNHKIQKVLRNLLVCDYFAIRQRKSVSYRDTKDLGINKISLIRTDVVPYPGKS